MENENTKDIGLKVGTKEEAFWTDVKEKAEIQKENYEKELKIINEMIKIAKNKILLEKRK